jgi:hypothetical protein
MKIFFRNLLNLALVFAITVSLWGCALSRWCWKEAEGHYKIIKDNSPQGWHMDPEPQPAYAALYVIAIPVDIATFPIQIPFGFCIIAFYDLNM